VFPFILPTDFQELSFTSPRTPAPVERGVLLQNGIATEREDNGTRDDRNTELRKLPEGDATQALPEKDKMPVSAG
jgi:hypothetical protein